MKIGETMKLQETLAFDDVLLVPQYSDIQSRKEVDISSHLDKNIKLDIPIVSSPMDTVTENDMAVALSVAGGLGIVHRYNSVGEQANIIKQAIADGADNIGGAVGVTGDYLERAQELINAGANVICVDVAHGHHISVKTALRDLRAKLNDKIHIMAGNVATLEGFNNVTFWGANSVRVGVGGGSICSTRIQTGHGMPTLTSIMECRYSQYGGTLVADGGIKTSGDIVKSLAAGADLVMLGSMLAGTHEAPGDIITDYAGVKYKAYRGMASKEAQIAWKGTYSSYEGVAHKVKYKGHVKDVLDDIVRNIRSGFSYSGARNIGELRGRSIFIKQTSASQAESMPHILNHGK